MAELGTFNLLTNPFFSNVILPFLLIFVVIYAILEKTNLLGQGKKYANVLVALVVGFVFVGVQSAVGFTMRLIPLTVMLVMILVCFYLVFGLITEGQKIKQLQLALGIIFGIAFIIIILWAAGVLDKVSVTGMDADVIGIIALLAVLGGAIAMVLSPIKAPSSEDE